MDRPARLPTTQAELEEWSVYADWLQVRGDPRGELIALELALPEEPDPDQLAAFQARVASTPTQHHGVVLTFALGYIQTLTVPRGPYDSAEVEDLERARALLAAEDGVLVEEIDLAFRPEDHLPQVRELLAALPPSCRRVGFDLCGPITDEAARELAAYLPSHVRELAMSAYGVRLARIGITGMSTWLDDRFDAIELRFKRSTFDVALGQLAFDRAMLVERAEQARHVRQQWTAVEAPFPPGRVEIGRPGDAAVVDLWRRCAIVLSRRSPSALQEDHGPLLIRTLRSGRVPQRHDVLLCPVDPDQPGLAIHSVEVSLGRRGDAWTLTRTPRFVGSNQDLRVDDDVVAPSESIEIGDGATIRTEDVSFVLVTHDVTRTVRDLLE